ncbi:hypothetical protein [Alteromonas sp. 009811495]|uniref:hypothetical protein n=1 Tax=Alteromonas sp. 009811495 TaxID=3002962 RepID=UPI00237E2BFB|nr:hypothetical protein [Alteromonas sp. 009811495]WDT85353.1 hypothetical protein OZ660_15640 [Alteromonas sp. 009811495]
MQIKESDLRDYIYDRHRTDLYKCISPVKKSFYENSLAGNVQKKVEERIFAMISSLKELEIQARELRLNKKNAFPIRVDLFGLYESGGIAIIELKVGRNAERQSFTELLAYTSYFSYLFPDLNKELIDCILIAPMQSRTIRDAYAQEVIFHQRNILVLIPDFDGNNLTLTPYLPEQHYYEFYTNDLFIDENMLSVAIEFPIIDGWIDNDLDNGGDLPRYTIDALNAISSHIAQRLETKGYHALVYATQKWGELSKVFPNPNAIYVAVLDPLAENIYETQVRDALVHELTSQMAGSNLDFWVQNLSTKFTDNLLREVREAFNEATQNSVGLSFNARLSMPLWHVVKHQFTDSVTVHLLKSYLTGFLNEMYQIALSEKYASNNEEEVELPGMAYEANSFPLFIWSILAQIGNE